MDATSDDGNLLADLHKLIHVGGEFDSCSFIFHAIPHPGKLGLDGGEIRLDSVHHVLNQKVARKTLHFRVHQPKRSEHVQMSAFSSRHEGNDSKGKFWR